MLERRIKKPLFPLLLVMGGLVLSACAGIAAVYSILQGQQSAQYPGSVQVSEHHVRTILPNFYMKESTSYLSGADFPMIFNWYSNRYQLGGESQAQSNCSHLFGTSSRLALTRSTSVTVCGTPEGQLIFVQRSTQLRYPKLFPAD